MSKINSHFQLLVYVNVRVVCNGSWNIETRIETQKATQGLGQILYGIGSLRNSSSFFCHISEKEWANFRPMIVILYFGQVPENYRSITYFLSTLFHG
jgi:hypothetical protein